MSFHRKKRPNPYKEANEAFLQVKAREEGIVALDNGVLYKVLEEGHGTRKPLPEALSMSTTLEGSSAGLSSTLPKASLSRPTARLFSNLNW